MKEGMYIGRHIGDDVKKNPDGSSIKVQFYEDQIVVHKLDSNGKVTKEHVTDHFHPTGGPNYIHVHEYDEHGVLQEHWEGPTKDEWEARMGADKENERER